MALSAAQEQARYREAQERAARFNHAQHAVQSAVNVIKEVADADTKKRGIEVIMAGFAIILEVLAAEERVADE